MLTSLRSYVSRHIVGQFYLVSIVVYLSPAWFVSVLLVVSSLLVLLFKSTMFLVLFIVLLLIESDCSKAFFLSCYDCHFSFLPLF